MAKEFLIKGIDLKLRKEFKASCAWHGITMKDSIIDHMRIIVNIYKFKKGHEDMSKPKQSKEAKKR